MFVAELYAYPFVLLKDGERGGVWPSWASTGLCGELSPLCPLPGSTEEVQTCVVNFYDYRRPVSHR